MHRKPKSHRHQMAAMSRWHRAERDRAEGIHDRAPYTDCRLPIVLDLTSYGGPFPARYPQIGRQLLSPGAIQDHDAHLAPLAVGDEPGYRLHRLPGPQRNVMTAPSGAVAVAVRPTGTGALLPSYE